MAAQEQDKINPDHYKVGGIETIEYIQAKLSPEEFDGYCKGNVIKYLSREKYKGGLEDIKKARWYIEKLVDVRGKEDG